MLGFLYDCVYAFGLSNVQRTTLDMRMQFGIGWKNNWSYASSTIASEALACESNLERTNWFPDISKFISVLARTFRQNQWYASKVPAAFIHKRNGRCCSVSRKTHQQTQLLEFAFNFRQHPSDAEFRYYYFLRKNSSKCSYKMPNEIIFRPKRRYIVCSMGWWMDGKKPNGRQTEESNDFPCAWVYFSHYVTYEFKVENDRSILRNEEEDKMCELSARTNVDFIQIICHTVEWYHLHGPELGA